MRLCKILWFALPVALLAQNGPQKPVVRASGEATVTVKPDRAEIDIGVVTEARSAQEAAASNARGTAAVLEKIKGLVAAAGSVRTVNYSLSPKYTYPQNAAPVIEGYTATNTVQVTADDLDLVGKLIDASTGAGSNSINGIRFTLKNDQAVRAEALRQAAQAAKANAEAIAQSLGLQVTGIVSAESEGASGVVPLRQPMMMMAKAAAPTPVEAGTIEIHASVTVTLAVAP
ncbi:MAG TPA: SIMPL domain-containing protein [Bryobacteraceae bacterium]|nr:SIMPL domain-containing protein [Bryobacteraceae bacterium]